MAESRVSNSKRYSGHTALRVRRAARRVGYDAVLGVLRRAVGQGKPEDERLSWRLQGVCSVVQLVDRKTLDTVLIAIDTRLAFPPGLGLAILGA